MGLGKKRHSYGGSSLKMGIKRSKKSSLGRFHGLRPFNKEDKFKGQLEKI